MPKSKPDIPTFESWDEVDGAGREVLKLEGEIDTAKAELDQKVADLKERSKQQLQDLKVEQKLLMQGIEDFVGLHRSELAQGTRQKSRQLTHIITGYRTNPPSVATRSKLSFAKVLDRAIALGAAARRYVRKTTNTELNKEQMLEDHQKGSFPEELQKQLGVKIARDEVFFVEPIRAQVAEADPAA